MKIGFFTDSYFPEIDGVTYTIKHWREKLEQDGHEVYVVYPDGDYEPGDREIPVPSVPNPFYRGYRVPLFVRLSTLPELDVVHCHGPAPVGILGRLYAWKNDVPSIYTHHTPLEEYFPQSVKSERLGSMLASAYVPWENSLLDSFDAVTASTERIERDVDHVQLPVGIDLDFFEPTEEDWYPDRSVVGYSGRISGEKNVHRVVELAERLPDQQFVIVGEGPCRSKLEDRAPDNVEFKDFLPREDLPTFYSSIDAFVTASTADTLGLSTLEANACGTPVAATDAAPFETTIQRDNGVRFEYDDLDDMAAAVESCLTDSRDTRSAVEEYSISHTLDRLEELYREVTLAADATAEPAGARKFSEREHTD
ncbi:Glycosyltransferase involved in cell wall bisynthesis [Natronoarchaeum philippinense]|uniref:Glycosyltransferase involved in cell wall bisynthesis n=1 Tax=Natronoarchaeum philippinense TaxID=558529 RepID=A0A285NA46_NATPI|nr:glycosyltransferase [Natronoarchaeum philippinense]SNZ05787.1 Glycosyltransferase involved in cell wall bisynthesis [Natronoarchaeum philippinense]